MVSCCIFPYRTAENKIDGAVVVLMDIHEMKSQAARLRHQAELMELSQDSVIVRDARTDLITSWNRGAHKMYGWSDQEALGKKSHLLLQTVTPAGPLNVDGILERDGFWEGEVIYTHKDGRKMTAESRQVLLREPETDTVSILQIDRDITSRLTLENDLKNYSEKLADADHRKNVFLACLRMSCAIPSHRCGTRSRRCAGLAEKRNRQRHCAP